MPNRHFEKCIERISAERGEIKEDSIIEDAKNIIRAALSGGAVSDLLIEQVRAFNYRHAKVYRRAANAGKMLARALTE